MAPVVFSQAQLDQVISETLPAALPNGHRNAIVGAVDQNGARVVAGFSLDEAQRWQFQGAFEHDWDGRNSVGARVLVSW